MLQTGRITEVYQLLWSSARETARDASVGQDDLKAITTKLTAYLQGADPIAFGRGHTTSLIAPVITLPPNATGYTCWDNTANRELFTIGFRDLTTTRVTDPTDMLQLDLFEINVQVPYSGIALTSLVPVAGSTRLSVTVAWTSMVDAPFEITPNLPAH